MQVRVIDAQSTLRCLIGNEYYAPDFPHVAGLSRHRFEEQADGTWKNKRGTVVVRVVTAASAPAEAPVSGQAFKADDGKPNWFLLMSGKGCAQALAGVVRVLSFAVRSKEKGGKGYTEHSWREVPNARERYESALYRHLNKIATGELVDDESGESHWDHVATNALFLSEITKAEASA